MNIKRYRTTDYMVEADADPKGPLLFGDGSVEYVTFAEYAHWCITTLGGTSYAWRPGIWIKGPLSPLVAPLAGPEATCDKESGDG